MNYKETLFFVSQCLTIQHCPERIPIIREKIRSGDVDWEQFVWVSSNQMMIPAVYLQFKRANLLIELPDDLVAHLEIIYQQNFDRNKEILQQVHRIIELLNKHSIYPIFLKGVGNLLDNLYHDIGERMMGDIDFLVAEKDVLKVAEILLTDGYKVLEGKNPIFDFAHRHFPRLVSPNAIAGVEIHYRIVKSPFDKKLSFKIINKEKKKLIIPGIAYVLSDSHQIIYNMMVVQINDRLFYRNPIYFRHIYDLFLLSMRTDPLNTLRNFGFYFQRLNNYLALSSKLLGYPISMSYEENIFAKIYVSKYMIDIKYVRFTKIRNYFLYIIFRLFNYLIQIIQASYKSSMRQSLYARLSDPKWYVAHLRSYNTFFRHS